MESIGDKLKTQREQKGYSIEQIARDTNIAKRYLEALEAEDFTVFLGDPYLIGFLRNYADYLGIDPDKMVLLYKNFQIQSQPVPIDELLVSKDKRPLLLIVIIVVVLGGLGTLGYLFIPKLLENLSQRERPSREAVEDESAGSTVYELQDEILERRFIEKDTITIPFKDSEYQIRLTNIGDDLTLTVPGGTNVLRIGDERAIDLDGDARMDIKVSLTDIDADAKAKTAVLRFDRFVKSTTPAEVAETEVAEPAVAVSSSDVGASSIASRQLEPFLIKQAETEEPFRVSIIFRGYCLFRYLLDDKERDERYFGKGDTMEIDVTRELRIWVSNAGNTIVKVSGEEIDLGRPGEVSTRMIVWRADESAGNSKLMMEAIY